MSLYNLAGQKVVEMVEGIREAGHHVVRWDGRDASGNSLASGIYVYRLTAGSVVLARKLSLTQ